MHLCSKRNLMMEILQPRLGSERGPQNPWRPVLPQIQITTARLAAVNPAKVAESLKSKAEVVIAIEELQGKGARVVATKSDHPVNGRVRRHHQKCLGALCQDERHAPLRDFLHVHHKLQRNLIPQRGRRIPHVMI